MTLTPDAVRTQLRSVLTHPSGFRDLLEIELEPRLTAPDPEQILLATLAGSRLTRHDQGSDHAMTIKQIDTGTGRADAGIALPNGIYYVSHQRFPHGAFPIFRLQRKAGTQRFSPVALNLEIEDMTPAQVVAMVEGRGMLFYNNTERPEPLFGFLSYEIQESQSYEILFVDLCVNYARNQLEESRQRMSSVSRSAESQDELFQAMVGELRRKAEIYYRLESLRDFFNLLTYLRYLGPTQWALSLAAEKQNVYRQLLEQTIPAIEAQLADAGSDLTLNQLVEQMDEALRRIRRGAPLLGRLRWQDIRNRSDAQIAASIRSVVAELLEDNDQAASMLDEDMEDIRRMLTIVPPRVMGVPRIFGTVERRHADAINSNAYYFWAVRRLKSHAAGFSIMLGLSSAVFAYFCPPVGVALGIFSAVVSVDQAIFHDALSDADIDVDRTFITQAEAREAAFWAGVDVLFVAVDAVTGLGAARRAVRSLGMADELATLPRTADELAGAATDAATDARTLARMGDAVDPDALARADIEVDVAATRADLAADPGRIDVSRSRQIETPPASAAEAIEDASSTVRQSIEQDLLPLVDQAYIAHFDNAAALGQKPLRWDDFARDWYAARIADEPPFRMEPPSRDGFFRQLAGPDGDLRTLLSDPPTLRQRLVAQLESGGIPPGMSRFDDRFIRDFRTRFRQGATPAELDDFVQQRFLVPIDTAASKAGFPPGEGREFGLFAQGVPNLGRWDHSAFAPLRRLFEDAAVDRGALHAILNRPAFRSASSPRFNMEVAVALERIRGVEGVLTRASLSNPPLIQSIARGNRGHGFEAIVVSRLLDDATREGARISVGRRWWLQEIDRLNATQGTNYTNVLEADILITLRDGRRVLVDAKFFRGGLSITRPLDSQLAKMATGIDEGLVHNAEYWVSHHFTRSREGLTNLDAFQTAADLYSGGRIHLVAGVYEGGFPVDFFRSSRFTEVSRGDVILVPPTASDLRLPGVSAPSPLPPAEVTAPPNAVVPVATTVGELTPAIRQSDVIRESSTVSRDLHSTYVPIHPTASSGRITVAAARLADPSAGDVTDFVLAGVRADTDIGGSRARDLAVGVATEVIKDRIRAAIGERDEEGELKFILTDTILSGGAPQELYTIAFAVHQPVAPGARYQLALYNGGDLVEVFPSPGEGWLLRQGWNVVPQTALEHDGEIFYPHRPGDYQWVLRFERNGRYVVYPRPLKMAVRPRQTVPEGPPPGDDDGDDDE